MNNNPQKMKTRCSPAVKRDQESSSSTAQQSAASSTDGRTRGMKRKASPDKTPRKRPRGSESETQKASEDDLRVRVLKRKIREDGEGPSDQNKEKKRRTDTNSPFAPSVEAESSGNSPEGCRRTRKRKAAADGEGPLTKKKRIPDQKKTEEETKEETKKREISSVDAQRAEFRNKYQEENQLGEGGCGSVFAGYRKADNLPVAIKHIPKKNVFCKEVDADGNQISIEVAVMLKLADGTSGSVGMSASVSLLDWYNLGQELILVQERPVPSKDLYRYIEVNGGSLEEEEAKIILKQLVEAAKELEDKCIFHRDIKVENILIETSSDVPRVRLIDFGLSCFVKKGSFFRIFYGTSGHVPPEWYCRSTYRAGPTTVWQLGVVLFDSLHRKASFETTKFLGKKLKINNKLSNNCQDFLRMCLMKNPEQRPTLEELQQHPWLR